MGLLIGEIAAETENGAPQQEKSLRVNTHKSRLINTYGAARQFLLEISEVQAIYLGYL